MKKTYLLWFACLAFLLLGCRSEDFTNQSANSQREEEFFREAQSKTARIKNGNNIVQALKKQNDKLHFVSKMKDQSGLPIWDKIITFKKTKTANKGESGEGTEEYIIPLTENDKGLSSILYVTKYPDDSFTFNNIDNEMLKQEVFNPQIDKDYREQLLLNFIAVDNLSFSKDAVYWNIPDDLLTSIPQSTIYPQRRFTATINTSENGGSTNNLNDVVICVTYEVPCSVCDENAGHHTYATSCFAASSGGYGGGLGDGGGGDTGGNPGGNNGGGDSGGGGGGLPTGNPGNNDDCGGANKTFYKVVPGCDDDDDDDGGNGELTPCEKIKTVGKNAKTLQLLGTLKTKTNSTKEFGYVLSENSGAVSETPFEGISGESSLSFPVNGPVDGVIHSHYGGLLSVFSVSDIFALAQIYKQGNIKNAYTFVIGVVTASNTQYLMVIDDLDMFGAFTNNLFTGNQIDRKMQDLYELVYESYGIKTNNTAGTNEKAFLSYLKTNHTGLKLLKGNSTFTNWQILNQDSKGNVIPENCP